jgi:hypothetical protein
LGKEISFIFLFVFAFSLVSAVSLPTHQVNTDLTIYQECFNCTYCNFTTFKGPSGTNLLTNMVAVQDNTHYSYLIDKGNITEQGNYRYCYNCGNDVKAETGCIDVPVTYTGKDLELPQTIMYIVTLMFLVGLLVYIISLYPKLPNHGKNQDGYVISVNSLAYLRPIAIGFMWILLLSITYIVANISVAYITAGFLGAFLMGVWQIMMYANLIIVPLWIIFMINDAFRKAKLKEFIERGGMDY